MILEHEICFQLHVQSTIGKVKEKKYQHRSDQIIAMEENSIKTLAFKETKERYHMWEFQMRAILRELGCAEALSRTGLKLN
jgi:hypothetical protein